MKIKSYKFSGVWIIEPEPKRDSRGFFMRAYDKKKFREYGLVTDWVQENHSLSIRKGTIRGLHFQLPPYTETKLIRVVRGKVLDVFVDVRNGSNTFGQWSSAVLSEDNYKMLYLPRGIAHGFCTLTANCEVVYKVDNYYSPEFERGLRWNDDQLGVRWPVNKPKLSDKDKKLPNFDKSMNYY